MDFYNKVILFIKSHFIQTVMTRKHMQGNGYDLLTGGHISGYINSNPYLAPIIYGFLRIGSDSRTKNLIASASAVMGDNLIWNNFKPIVLLLAGVLLLTAGPLYVIIPLIIYIAGVSVLRFTGYSYGSSKERPDELFEEQAWVKSIVLLRTIKFILMGIIYLYVILQLALYLNTAPLYVIITILIAGIYIILKRDIDFLLLIVIILTANMIK
ncbi:MAG: hypothetical protein R6U31_07010 [bacterium]